MKLGKYFPLIVLVLLSCLVLFALPAYQFFSSEYPKDLALKFNLSLRQGLGLAAAVLLFVWLGAGTNALLARIKEKKRRTVVSLIAYLASFFVCIALPLLSLLLTYSLFSPHSDWKQLPAPPETPVSIAAGGQQSVIIETDKGNYYLCIINNERCWQPENKPESPAFGEEYGVKTTGNMPRVAPPGQVVDMLGITYNTGPVDYESHYAILDDGTVWYLNIEVNNYSGGFMAGMLAMIVIPVLFCAVMFFVGAGIHAVTRWAANRIWPETA